MATLEYYNGTSWQQVTGLTIQGISDIMPIMAGVNWYFDYALQMLNFAQSVATWRNLISGYNNITLTGASVTKDGVILTSAASSYGKLIFEKSNNLTIYLVVKMPTAAASWEPLIMTAIPSDYHALGIWTGSSASAPYLQGVPRHSSTNIVSSIIGTSWHVCALVQDYSTSTIKFYIDGTLIGSSSIFDNDYESTLYLAVTYFISSSSIGDAWGTSKYYKFLAISNQAHSATDISQNTTWLKGRFGIS